MSEQGENAARPVLEVLTQYLDVLRREARDPNDWERLSLNLTLNALDRGQITLAYSEIRNAMTPPDNASPAAHLSKHDKALIENAREADPLTRRR